MRTFYRYLIIRSDGDCRVVTRKPTDLRYDEVCYPLHVYVPDAWGLIAKAIELVLPEPATMEVDNEPLLPESPGAASATEPAGIEEAHDAAN